MRRPNEVRCGIEFTWIAGLGWVPANSRTFADQRPRFANLGAAEEWAAAIRAEEDGAEA